jgi:hypothetical protein
LPEENLDTLRGCRDTFNQAKKILEGSAMGTTASLSEKEKYEIQKATVLMISNSIHQTSSQQVNFRENIAALRVIGFFLKIHFLRVTLKGILKSGKRKKLKFLRP